MAKNKIRSLFYTLLLFIGQTFPSTGLINEIKSLEEMEDDGDIYLGV